MKVIEDENSMLSILICRNVLYNIPQRTQSTVLQSLQVDTGKNKSELDNLVLLFKYWNVTSFGTGAFSELLLAC